MEERKEMKTREELRAESAALLSEFRNQGGTIEILKDKKNPKPRTANAKNKGGRVFSDPTARFPKR
jgi:hypothetical protein